MKDVKKMSNAELESERSRASARAHNPLRTHGSHVRSAERMRNAEAEQAQRRADGRG